MSRNLQSKFHFSVLKSQLRLLTTKLDVIHLPHRSNIEEHIPEDVTEEHAGNTIRYNVCRENASCQKFVFNNKRPVHEPAPHNQFEDDFEQEDNSLPHHSLPVLSNAEKGYRSFSVSTTQKNVILPLKSSKLASPFPDPVKVMPSHTVSDQEKADQMQAEARVPRSITKARRI